MKVGDTMQLEDGVKVEIIRTEGPFPKVEVDEPVVEVKLLTGAYAGSPGLALISELSEVKPTMKPYDQINGFEIMSFPFQDEKIGGLWTVFARREIGDPISAEYITCAEILEGK